MAVEIEKKYRMFDDQPTLIRDRLREFGAECMGVDFEENVIYGGGALDEKPAILRVRNLAERTILTFKRRLPGDQSVKRQTEYETEVADAGELANIIAELGFEPRIVYEKRRETWCFRSVEVVLDELPFGMFMEIEGSLTSIAEAEMLLEAEDFEAVHETYPALTSMLGKRNGNVIEARFERTEEK